MGGEGDAQGGGSVENFRGWAYSGAGGNCGLLFVGRAGRMPAGIPYRRRGSGEPGRLRGGISSRRSGGGDYSACAGLIGVGHRALAVAGAAAGLHRAGASRAATSVCGTGISAGLFDCLICAPVRRRGLSAGPFGLWGERCAFGAGAVCAWGAGPPGRPGAGRTGLGGWENPSALWKTLFFPLRRLCRRAVCESAAGLLCSARPGVQPGGDVPEPIEILREGVGRMDYQSGYAHYLTEEKRASANTLSSYLRDVTQYLHWLEGRSIEDAYIQIFRVVRRTCGGLYRTV